MTDTEFKAKLKELEEILQELGSDPRTRRIAVAINLLAELLASLHLGQQTG